MKLFQKILLSIIPTIFIVSFIYVFIINTNISMNNYFLIWGINLTLIIINNILLLLFILNSRISKKEKILYIMLNLSIILFQYFYIWIIDNKLPCVTSSHIAKSGDIAAN